MVDNIEIDLQVTNKCNLYCPHCIYSSCKDGKHMPLDMMLDIIPSLKKIGCKTIHITGGEPLLHPKLFEFIKIAHKNDINTRLQTNGLLLQEKITDLIDCHIEDVLISIDGLQYYHDRFRNYNGLYKICLSSIDKLKKNGITVRVNSAICKDNISQIYKLSNVLENHNVDFHSYFYLTPLGRGKTMREKCLSPSEWYNFYEKTSKNNYNKNIKIKIQKAFVNLNENMHSLCRLSKKNNIHVSLDGTVYPCVFLIGTKMSLGNLNNEKLENIWLNEKRWKKIYEEINSKKCPYGKVCFHGCFGFSYQLKNSFKNCDPRCQGGDIVPNCIRTYEEI